MQKRNSCLTHSGSEDKDHMCQHDGQDPSYALYRRHCVLDEFTAKELQRSKLLMENRELELKLQALREAGVSSLRTAAARLASQYQQQAQDQQEMHDHEKKALLMNIMEKEDHLNRSMENLFALQTRMQDEQKKVVDVEKLLERMETEKTALTVKRKLLEHKMRCRVSEMYKSGTEAESFRRHKIEICTLGEKICHLEKLILTQSSRMRSYLNQIKQLTVELSAQERAIESLTERLHAARAQNIELKYKLEFWSS